MGARPENKEIKGTIVYPGKITGRVVIIRPAWHDDQVAIRKAMEDPEDFLKSVAGKR
ncbi:hypothetical protein HYT92_03525, partial [Candidatus Pacearchaeota archaeon]|nr:hypothetical protein [Candidatus Pacearchaeota archaeon]